MNQLPELQRQADEVEAALLAVDAERKTLGERESREGAQLLAGTVAG